eukprot:1136256-Pelagomonas_calceolata.AAC.6
MLLSWASTTLSPLLLWASFSLTSHIWQQSCSWEGFFKSHHQDQAQGSARSPPDPRSEFTAYTEALVLCAANTVVKCFFLSMWKALNDGDVTFTLPLSPFFPVCQGPNPLPQGKPNEILVRLDPSYNPVWSSEQEIEALHRFHYKVAK